MSELTHPTLTVLGEKLTTIDMDFSRNACCVSPLGEIHFQYRQSHWEWFIVTTRTAEGDEYMLGGLHTKTLEELVENCETQLKALVNKAVVFKGLKMTKEGKLLKELETAVREYQEADKDDVRHAIYEGHTDGLCAIEGPKQVRRFEEANTALADKLKALDELRSGEKAG